MAVIALHKATQYLDNARIVKPELVAEQKVVVVFWIALSVLFYVYFGYPLLLALTRLIRKPEKSEGPEEAEQIYPSVTMVISAYNEEQVIESKLSNALAIDYPEDKFSVLVVSDCSDDQTDQIVNGFDSDKVRLIRMDQRSGKSAGLNRAVEHIESELILFTDANAMFERDSVKTMVRHFSDPHVGVVTGQQRYANQEGDGEDATQEGLYWRYECKIKSLESQNGNLVGGDGAIMAIRTRLYFELADDDLSDFLIPLRISMSGFRNVYEPNAFCNEEAADSYDKEFRRKVRIVNRAWRATMKSASVLNPTRFGVLSLCVWSHKVLRWVTAIWMATFIVATASVYQEGWIYTAAALGQAAFYGFALLGAVMKERTSISLFTIPYYFCMVNIAALKGIMEHYQGKTYATWNTPRTA